MTGGLLFLTVLALTITAFTFRGSTPVVYQHTETFEVGGIAPNYCSGEYLQLSGDKGEAVITVVEDGDSFAVRHQYTASHINVTAMSSGAAYSGSEASYQTFSGKYTAGAYSETFRNTIRARSRNGLPDLKISVLYRLTITAGGKVSVFRVVESADCR